MEDHIVSLLQEAENLKKELDSLRPLDKEREAIIMQKLRLDWNFHSNHLEGNSLTFGETKALILFGITAQGKPLKDHFEITGHDEAIKWVEDIVLKKEPLTESFIRQLHKLLLKEDQTTDAITLDGQPTKKTIKVGEYKSTPNHVKTKTGEIFRFATPEETPAKMNDLIEWLREKEEAKDTNPILLAADFHYKFIRIHPFDDGNGRIARILMNFILMQNGYPPVIVKTQEKPQYIAALEQADAGVFEPFFEFIITNEINSLELMLKGAKGEDIEDPDDLDKEIALLKQKIKSDRKEVKIERNNDVIKKLYDESYSKLMLTFFNSLTKAFKDLYLQVLYNPYTNSGGKQCKTVQEAVDFMTGVFKSGSGIYKISFEVYFKNLRYLSESESNSSSLRSTIHIDFNDDTLYKVFSRHNYDTEYFRKFYDQPLSRKEIDFIVKEEKKLLLQELKNKTGNNTDL